MTNRKDIPVVEKVNRLLLLIKERQNHLGEKISVRFDETKVHERCFVYENEVKWLLEQLKDKGYVKLFDNINDGKMVEITLDGERYIEGMRKGASA